MPITQHFIVEGQYLGQSIRSLKHYHNEVGLPPSYAFFCPVCAEVWARCPVDLNGKLQPFMAWSVACKKHEHPHGLWVPGSLMLSWDKPFTDSLPDAAVRRELIIHLDWAEKKGIEV